MSPSGQYAIEQHATLAESFGGVALAWISVGQTVAVLWPGTGFRSVAQRAAREAEDKVADAATNAAHHARQVQMARGETEPHPAVAP